jgi:mono/diheme cytochrome c family protein
MSKVRRARLAFAVAYASALFLIAPASAEQAQEQSKESAKHPGLALLRAKCFQCHTDAMWRDARQDARWWEAALYRMVGRGGIWTTDEIRVMADYLGTDFGPNAKPPERAKQ